ncbi:hypothetical protein HPB50_023056 [Hyalomma asiaticum]|uniref:Uncharacterized protein n=1 Tax=Hyalomma asiaticum TaxID=266040 RepID=A0ACB7TM23_HYAAI|nr:hypothetical protein HPB50_023056 [Hyalomma asiaticum]
MQPLEIEMQSSAQPFDENRVHRIHAGSSIAPSLESQGLRHCRTASSNNVPAVLTDLCCKCLHYAASVRHKSSKRDSSTWGPSFGVCAADRGSAVCEPFGGGELYAVLVVGRGRRRLIVCRSVKARRPPHRQAPHRRFLFAEFQISAVFQPPFPFLPYTRIHTTYTRQRDYPLSSARRLFDPEVSKRHWQRQRPYYD